MQLVTGTYTGNGVDDRWINDPGFEPDLVIIKADAANAAVWRTSDMGVGESFWFSVYGGASGNRIQDFGANGFQVGTEPSWCWVETIAHISPGASMKTAGMIRFSFATQ